MSERKPEIRFGGYEDSWEARRFGDVFDMLSNNTLSRDSLNNEYGNTLNVHYGDVLIKFGEYLDVSKEKLPFISDEDVVAKFQSSILKDGDIVIADTAEDETVGKCTEICNVGDLIVIPGLHTIPCRPKEEFAELFLGYYLNSCKYHDQLIPLMQGVKVMSLSRSGIKDTHLGLPKTVCEQRDIGYLLSLIDECIKNENKSYDRLSILRLSMLEKMFPKKEKKEPEIRFIGNTADWSVIHFGEMADYKKGPFGSTLKKEVFVPKSNSVVKVYEQQNAISKDWTLERYYVTKEYARDLKAFEVHGGDIIVSCAGTIGEIYELPEDATPGIINQALMRVRVNENIVTKSIYKLLFTNMIDEFSREHSNGSAMKNIPPFADLKSMATRIPSVQEQKKIGQFFEVLNRKIQFHHTRLIKLKNIKTALMNGLFV